MQHERERRGRLSRAEHGWIRLAAAALSVTFLAAVCLSAKADSGPSADPPLRKAAQVWRGTVLASDPSVVLRRSDLAMAYTDLDVATNRTVLALAVSNDGRRWRTEWNAQGVGGLVLAGREGRWDENLESAALLRTDRGWRLYYSGYPDEGRPVKGFPAALGLAASGDGRTFVRSSDEPVLRPTPGWYDNDAVYSPTLLHERGAYTMIYVGHAYTDVSKIGAGGVYLLWAVSDDGVIWRKGEAPLAGPGSFGDWRRDGLAEPFLVRRGPGAYLLFYTGLRGEERALGVATAPTPTGPWDFGRRPILRPGPPGSADARQVLAPSVLLEGDLLRLWYLAVDSRGRLSVGYAEGSLQEVLAASR